ncbi:MAG: four helix bundle protein [Actinomycetota bacterium]
MRKYEELLIWQKSIELAHRCYDATADFPREERFGLTSQMRRAAVSIPSNIAEGSGRDLPGDFAKFLRYAYGSGCELATQTTIAQNLELGDSHDLANLHEGADEVRRMIYAFVKHLERSSA